MSDKSAEANDSDDSEATAWHHLKASQQSSQACFKHCVETQEITEGKANDLEKADCPVYQELDQAEASSEVRHLKSEKFKSEYDQKQCHGQLQLVEVSTQEQPNSKVSE